MMDGQIYDTKSIHSLKYYNYARLNQGSLSQLYINGHPYNDYYSNHTISLPNCILYKKLTFTIILVFRIYNDIRGAKNYQILYIIGLSNVFSVYFILKIKKTLNVIITPPNDPLCFSCSQSKRKSLRLIFRKKTL